MVTVPVAGSALLLSSFTKLGISAISVLVLNWLPNSMKCVVLFTSTGCGSEQVGSTNDLGCLCGSVLEELPKCCAALGSAASLRVCL